MTQSPASLRSEEYRQLFHLPAEEVLIEDFNCACQDNVLLQGHMYLFLHYICFYSNIFGYETKKIIPLIEVTSVQRAKTAGIFPNAIEINAGGKKHFFGSFLSRDEAFKLINQIWLQHGNDEEAIIEQETPESSSHSNGFDVFGTVEESDSADRDDDTPSVQDPEPRPTVEDDTVATAHSELKDNIDMDTKHVNANSSSLDKTWTWKEDTSEAPKIPESYTVVAESKFSIKERDFFSFFFSDDSFDFTESFHGKCGDKDFKCTSWAAHNQFGHTRKVEFLHPIKIYFGAKYGSCKEVQQFWVYQNSHLVIKTSQEINDVPYGDYFRVEGLWDLQRDRDDSEECCHLRVYVNVNFSKSTVFRGKIVQSTIEECREVYGIWISLAHEYLEKKNLENQGDTGTAARVIENAEVKPERNTNTEESFGRPRESGHHLRAQTPDTKNVNQVGNHMQENVAHKNSSASVSREPKMKFWSSLYTQSHLPLLVVIAFGVIILMQMSMLMLLARPQKVQVISHSGFVNGMGSGATESERSMEVLVHLEKRIEHLKEDMFTVEAQLKRMSNEHALLKAQLNDMSHARKKA